MNFMFNSYPDLSMFSLKTLLIDQAPVACLSIDGKDYSITALCQRVNSPALPDSVLDLLAQWETHLPKLKSLAEQATAHTDLILSEANATLPPVLYPGKILCAGANYYDHLQEMGVPAEKKDQRLFFFFKPARQAAIGDGQCAAIPKNCQKYDWEIELAMVIGKTAKDLTLENAMEHVAGYTIAIDLSARDFARAPEQFYKFDWVAAKANDASCPIGPALIPACFVSDPQDLDLKLELNGQIKQEANTSGMIFDLREQLVRLTEIMTLEPGDIVLTGTPAGVGAARGEFLAPGDQLHAHISGLGTLNTTIA